MIPHPIDDGRRGAMGGEAFASVSARGAHPLTKRAIIAESPHSFRKRGRVRWVDGVAGNPFLHEGFASSGVDADEKWKTEAGRFVNDGGISVLARGEDKNVGGADCRSKRFILEEAFELDAVFEAEFRG